MSERDEDRDDDIDPAVAALSQHELRWLDRLDGFWAGADFGAASFIGKPVDLPVPCRAELAKELWVREVGVMIHYARGEDEDRGYAERCYEWLEMIHTSINCSAEDAGECPLLSPDDRAVAILGRHGVKVKAFADE